MAKKARVKSGHVAVDADVHKTMSQHPAYSYGYRTGRKKERERRQTIIDALNKQIDYWRTLYEEEKKKHNIHLEASARRQSVNLIGAHGHSGMQRGVSDG